MSIITFDKLIIYQAFVSVFCGFISHLYAQYIAYVKNQSCKSIQSLAYTMFVDIS